MTISLQLGDRVYGKKTGNLVPSTVVGIIPANLYTEGSKQVFYNLWDMLYPNWREGLIVLCKFDEPTRNMTLQEFQTQVMELPESSEVPFVNELINNQSLYSKYVKFMYEREVQPKWHVAYPYDDIEVV